MCLTIVELNTKWDGKEKDFVGYGYKAYPSKLFDNIGRIKSNDSVYQNQKLYKSKWMEANGSKYSAKDLSKVITAHDSDLYFPGFHIFLKEDDAKKYGETFLNNFVVVKVKFKTITSFGTNQTHTSFGPCVVTRFLKIVEVIK